MTRLPKIIYWLPALIWMAIIFTLSSKPALHASPVQWQDVAAKKTAHYTEYFILNFLIFVGFSQTTKFSLKKRVWLCILLSILYSFSDEFHQTLVIGREGTVRDVLVDAWGIASSSYSLFSAPQLPHNSST